SQGYREACFDGINLFFARKHDRTVADTLVPASTLDDYEPAASAAMRAELHQLRGYIETVEQELARHQAAQLAVSDYVRSLEDQLAAAGPVAPVIDLGNVPYRAAPPPPPARLAIIGTPRT